jgi:hypothetical protein
VIERPASVVKRLVENAWWRDRFDRWWPMTAAVTL